MSLSPDVSRFLVANAVGLSLALPYAFVPKSIRNEFNYLPGILMVYYCFGRQANTLVLFSAISYVICRYSPRDQVQRITLCISLAFLSYAHLSRQFIDYGGYVLDISGPFMIAVQKMTSLGFCLYDGKFKQQESKLNFDNNGNNKIISKGVSPPYVGANNNDIYSDDDGKQPRSTDSLASTSSVIGSMSNYQHNFKQTIKRDINRLTEEQRRYAIISVPSFNEFLGYFFHFPSVLCGPIMYFRDYIDFVNNTNHSKLPPGRFKAAARKLAISIGCAILHLTLNPRFDVEFLRMPEFLIRTSVIVRFYYILIFTILSRLKYYVAWHLGEAISNTSGLGFNGYGANGRPQWNLISNMEIFKFETSLSLRDAILAWNKTTQTWLRRTAYERAPRKLSLIATYTLSAVWHGFYPGYYMTFLGGALFTHASRNGRRYIRPIFQRGKLLPRVYDVITFILTRLTIAYTAFPFVILDFKNNFEIYRSLYFSIHLLAVGGVILGFILRRK